MDWKARINRARRTGGFTPKDRELALDFASCAVGERIPALKNRGSSLTETVEEAISPSELTPVAEASKMVDLGYYFNEAVSRGDIERAEEVYHKIQMVPLRAPKPVKRPRPTKHK